MKKVLVLLAMLAIAPLPVLAGPTPIIVDAPTPAAQISETVIYTDLNGVQVGASLEQVGGKAMAEHVGIDTFLNPGAAGGFDTSVVGRLVIHGVISAVPAVAGK